MSFFIALMTGLGVGSGGLYVLWLVFFKNLAQGTAQGLNLLFFSTAITASTLVNFLHGRIKGKVLVPVLLFGILSSVPASFLSGQVSSQVLSRLFGSFLVVSGLAGLFSGAK